MMQNLQSNQVYDVLIIGGGATGSGTALDAALRGLKVACVEQEDFSSGTSSKSTKLLWGGSRYLVQAIVSLLNFNLLRNPIKTINKFRDDLKMVMSAHRERKFLLLKQHHLTYWQPIAVPITSWFQWPPPFGFPLAAIGPIGLYPLFFKLVVYYFF
jgi:glycerol-3-phosphate dehydrogenase